MKKLLAALLFLMSFTSFAWKTIETVDEFKEPTGEIRILQYEVTNDSSWVFIDKTKEGYDIGFRSSEYIGGKGRYDESEIKIKVDSESPETLYAYVWSNGQTLSTTLTESVLDKMKKGKSMKVLIQKYDDQNVLLKFNLDDFEEQLKKVK